MNPSMATGGGVTDVGGIRIHMNEKLEKDKAKLVQKDKAAPVWSVHQYRNTELLVQLQCLWSI